MTDKEEKAVIKMLSDYRKHVKYSRKKGLRSIRAKTFYKDLLPFYLWVQENPEKDFEFWCKLTGREDLLDIA
jgi:hypothetical protein